MIPYTAYKTFHLIGIFLILLSLGGQAVNSLFSQSLSSSWKRHLSVTHGIGLVLMLIAGFGLLARLGITWPWPVWILLKVLGWLILGFIPTLITRFPESSRTIWWMSLVIAGLAAWLANYRPLI